MLWLKANFFHEFFVSTMPEFHNLWLSAFLLFAKLKTGECYFKFMGEEIHAITVFFHQLRVDYFSSSSFNV